MPIADCGPDFTGSGIGSDRLDGYDYLCLSDHHNITFTNTVKAPDDFVLIQGAELHPDNPFGGQKHHFACLNLNKDMDAQHMPP